MGRQSRLNRLESPLKKSKREFTLLYFHHHPMRRLALGRAFLRAKEAGGPNLILFGHKHD